MSFIIKRIWLFSQKLKSIPFFIQLIFHILITFSLVLQCCSTTIEIHVKSAKQEKGALLKQSHNETNSEVDLEVVEEYVWNGTIPLLQYLQQLNASLIKPEKEEDDILGDFSFINFKTPINKSFELPPIDETRLRTRQECTFDPNDNFHASAIELLRIEGHEAEIHNVTSPDGYIIQFHRIAAPGKPAVLLMPGIFQSSRDFLINCKGRTLGNMLFKSGFDVWYGNYRGGVAGRHHANLNPKDKQFWEFVPDAMALYDSTAAVDYILAKTGHQKLNYVGYSLGATMLYGLLAGSPEYNAKMNVAITLAPAVFFNHIKTMLIKYSSPYGTMMESYMRMFYHGEVAPPEMLKMFHGIAPRLCKKEAVTGIPGVCAAFLQTIDGVDPVQLNYPRLPLIAGGFPSPISVRLVAQWFQWITHDTFAKYDYGPIKNMYKYGTAKPPIYDLSKVTAPVVIFWSENDYITDKRDVFRLMQQLPNVEAAVRVNWKKWTHIDYLYGKDADILVYEPVINILKYKNHPAVLAASST